MPAPTPNATATVAAVLHPRERARVEAAGLGCFALIHRESVREAIQLVRERPVAAVLLSVHQCRAEQVEQVDALVRRFPSVPAVALVTAHDAEGTASLLRLGASGVRTVVDATEPRGWQRLREVVREPATLTAARIQGRVFAALPELSADARLFLEALIRLAPATPTVRGLTRRFGVQPSTIVSRFQRAGLPSPKAHLAMLRLVHAAALFADPGRSVADVAYRLDFSSPQAFGRHVRGVLGITATELRRRFPFDVLVERFVAELVAPHARTWAGFRPLAGVGAEAARRRCAGDDA